MGALNLGVLTKAKGYAPGEMLDVDLSYDNFTSGKLTKLKINLEQVRLIDSTENSK